MYALVDFRKFALRTGPKIGRCLVLIFDFLFHFGWMVTLLPTYQVLNCSPIALDNQAFGTRFRHQEKSEEILQEAYTSSECFHNYAKGIPYSMSALPIRVKLIVNPYELLKLKTNKYVTYSERMVNGKTYSLALVVEPNYHQAVNFIANEMKKKSIGTSTITGNKHKLELVGTFETFHTFDTRLSEWKTKKRLRINENVYLRPVKFTVLNAQYKNSTPYPPVMKTLFKYGSAVLMVIFATLYLFYKLCPGQYVLLFTKTFNYGGSMHHWLAKFSFYMTSAWLLSVPFLHSLLSFFKWSSNAKWSLALLATFQAWMMSSSFVLNNRDLGSLIRMDMTEGKFMSAVAEMTTFANLYKYSLYNADIKLLVHSKDLTVIKFKTPIWWDKDNHEKKYFLLKSDRLRSNSSIFMILETSGLEGDFLYAAKKEQPSFFVIGKISNLDDDVTWFKNYLETRFGRNIRPVKLQVLKVHLRVEYKGFVERILNKVKVIVIDCIVYCIMKLYGIFVMMVFLWVFPKYIWADLPEGNFQKIIMMGSVWFTLFLLNFS